MCVVLGFGLQSEMHALVPVSWIILRLSKIIAQTIYQGTKVVMEVKLSLVYFKCKNEVFSFVKDAV